VRRVPGLLAAFLFWLFFAAIYLGIQASLPFVVGRIPAYFVILFAVLLLGVVVFLAGSDKRWRFVLVIAFFLIMSGQLPVFFGGTRLNTRVIETLLRLILMAFVALDTLALRRRVWPPLWLLVIFVSHVGLLGLSWVGAEYITEIYATREVLLMHLTGLFLFIAGYVYVRSWRHVVSFASVMVVGAAAFALLGIVEYIAGEQYYRLYLRAFPYMTERIQLALAHHRVIGPFDNQVAFGSWLAMFVTIPLALKANEHQFKRRVIWNVVLILLWVCLFFTGSRGPFLGAFAGFVIYSWLTGRIKKAFVVNTVMGLLVLVVVAYGGRIARMLPENNLILRFVDPAAAVRSGGDVFETVRDARLKTWQDAIEEWRHRPILGIGPGEWVKRRLKVYEQGRVTTVSSFSPYVQYLVENGILGLASLALLLVVLGVYNVRLLARLKPGPRRDLIASLSVACLIVHLVSLTDVGYGTNRLFYFFWMAQGVLLMGARLALEEESEQEKQAAGSLLQGWRPGWRAPASRLPVAVYQTGMGGHPGP
jgi:O-antigen ligase